MPSTLNRRKVRILLSFPSVANAHQQCLWQAAQAKTTQQKWILGMETFFYPAKQHSDRTHKRKILSAITYNPLLLSLPDIPLQFS